MKATYYARVSSEEQAKSGTSIETQPKQCIAAIEARGWVLVPGYTEAGVSGEAEHRPELERLKADARRGLFQRVVIVSSSRLARDERVAMNIEHALKQAGVRVVDLEMPVADHGDVQFLMDEPDEIAPAMLRVVNSFENRRRKAFTVRGLRAVAERGFWPGGTPPFGYKTTPVQDGGATRSKLVIDEGQAETLRTAAQLIVNGCSTQEAAVRLNALGLKPPRAAVWSAPNLRRALLQRSLIGEVAYAKQSKYGYGHGRKRDRAWGPPVVIGAPAILDQATWDALQARLNATAHGPAPKRPHYYELSGLLVGTCGLNMFGTYRKERRGGKRQYRCAGAAHDPTRQGGRCLDTHRIDAQAIEAWVWEKVTAILSDPEALLARAQEWLGVRGEEMASEREQAEQIENAIAKHTKALTDELYAIATSSEIAAKAHRAVAERLEGELTALHQQRAQLAAWRDGTAAESTYNARVLELAELAHSRMGTMSAQQRRSLLDVLDVRIEVTGYWNHGIVVRLTGSIPLEGDIDLLETVPARRRARVGRRVGRQGLEPCPPD